MSKAADKYYFAERSADRMKIKTYVLEILNVKVKAVIAPLAKDFIMSVSRTNG